MKYKIISGIVMILLLSAASCATKQGFTGSGLPKLAFVGDSITVQSTDDINAHYGTTYDVANHSVVGVGVTLMAPQILRDAAVAPDIEIINLGTNDAHGGNLGAPAKLDEFAATFPSTTCVIFVTINTHNPSWGPEVAQQINEHIRSTFAHVADWDADWHSSYFNKSDDPHPNEIGRQALLAVEDAAIATC